MLKREKYINQLIESKDLGLIKVITGVRRSGKSTLLLQYKDYLLSQDIQEKILYIWISKVLNGIIEKIMKTYIKGHINNG